MKDGMGFVHLRGMVKSGSSTIFTLPVGYRPEFICYCSAVSSGPSVGIAAVHPDGTITMDAGSNAYFSLDSVIFRAYQ
jgi:hypothetical protein